MDEILMQYLVGMHGKELDMCFDLASMLNMCQDLE